MCYVGEVEVHTNEDLWGEPLAVRDRHEYFNKMPAPFAPHVDWVNTGTASIPATLHNANFVPLPSPSRPYTTVSHLNVSDTQFRVVLSCTGEYVDFLYNVVKEHVPGFPIDPEYVIRDRVSNKVVQFKMRNPYLEAFIQSVVSIPLSFCHVPW